MTTAGPWLDDPMWTPPDEDGPDQPKVVREHYFLVCARVFEDGTREWNTDTSIEHFDGSRPIYSLADESWERVSDDLYHTDQEMGTELRARLGEGDRS